MTLRAMDLVKGYHGRIVVNRVSFQVQPGEVAGLLGPNGAGKTTTFYLAVGLVAADAGEIWLGENNLTSLPIHRRARLGLGHLAQGIFPIQKNEGRIVVSGSPEDVAYNATARQLYLGERFTYAAARNGGQL